MSRYPDTHRIEEMFANRGNPQVFESYATEPCEIVAVGAEPGTGGKYRSVKSSLTDGHFSHVVAALKLDTVSLDVRRVIGGGDSPWAAVEMVATADTHNGLPFNSEHVYIVRFNSDGKINYIKTYSDTAHVQRHIKEHEKHVAGQENAATS